LFAVLAFAGPASSQVISLSFTGSGTGTNNSINGTGTGTLSPGGAAVVSLTGVSSNNDNCDSRVQLSEKLIVDANDSITVLFNAPQPNTNANSFSLNGTLTVTAGTGTYSGKGGSGSGTVAVQLGSSSNNNNTQSFTFTFTGTVTLAGPLVPVASLTPSGIVPVFTDIPTLQPGSWVSVYGANLANATTLWNGDFPTSLGGVSVTIDGNAAYFWFVSAAQINLQAPDDSKTGCVPVVLNTPNGTITTSVQLEPISPSLSLLDNQYVVAEILTPNGSGAYGGVYDLAGPVGHFSYPTRPARRGESVVLYGVGFGPTTPAVPAGKLFYSAAPTTNQVYIYLGNNQGNFIQVIPAFSGLVGAGLYQINITIPNNAPSGDLILQATVGGNGTSGNNGVQTSGDFNVLLSVQ
jgi:uncharacterized protein (TIGR03437 family)